MGLTTGQFSAIRDKTLLVHTVLDKLHVDRLVWRKHSLSATRRWSWLCLTIFFVFFAPATSYDCCVSGRAFGCVSDLAQSWVTVSLWHLSGGRHPRPWLPEPTPRQTLDVVFPTSLMICTTTCLILWRNFRSSEANSIYTV